MNLLTVFYVILCFYTKALTGLIGFPAWKVQQAVSNQLKRDEKASIKNVRQFAYCSRFLNDEKRMKNYL